MFNEISKIQSGSLKKLTKLTYLNLYKNSLDQIEPHAFEGMEHLQHLILSNSHITRVNNDMIGSLPSLRYLSFEDCTYLEYVEGSALKQLPSLEELSFQSCTNLVIDKKIFQNITNLTILKLDEVRKMNTSVITDKDSFQNTNLERLYISHLNNISDFPMSLYGLNITHLDISYNNIHHMKRKIVTEFLDKFQRLKVFQADHNPYICTCGLSDYVRFLNKSYLYKGVEIGAEDDYVCITPSALEKHSIFDLEKEKYMCFVPRRIVPLSTLYGPFIVEMLILIICVTLSVIIRFRLYFFNIYRKYLFALRTTKDYDYDAYIAYSSNDSNLIISRSDSCTFHQQLDSDIQDGKERFKLAIRERDFPVGSHAEIIVEFMEKSRKLIFILSDDFITNKDSNDRCNFEIQFALQMLNDGDFSRIIIVVKNPISQSAPDLLEAVRRERACFDWPTTPAQKVEFWESLRSELRAPKKKQPGEAQGRGKLCSLFSRCLPGCHCCP